MSTLNAICLGIAKTIQNYADQQVYAYEYMAQVTSFPAVVCEPVQPQISYAGQFAAHQTASDFDGSFGVGMDMWYIGCYVLVSGGTTKSQQNLLNQFLTGCGPNSVRQILHEHGDIGLEDTTAVPVGVSHYGGSYAPNAIAAVGALVTVRVITRASDANPFNTN